MSDERGQYDAWLAAVEASGVTPSLAEFARWWEFDSNLPWRMDAGHLINLLETAVDQIEQVTEIVDPAWLAARVLPRMVGAEEMAQVAAIRAVLAQDDTEGTDPSETG